MEILRLKSIPSTNSALLEMSKKSAKSWTAVWTSHQTSGRGYAGNVWVSQKDKNIAVSVLIDSELGYDELIYFNQWAAVCIRNFLSDYISDIYVKWPNDILAHNKKIVGVLIETHKSHNSLKIILGIGLNVNQKEFPDLTHASSLALLGGKDFDLEEILSGLLTNLKNHYWVVENKDWKTILEDYNHYLFRRNQISLFKINGEIQQGIIRKVDEKGLLWVEFEKGNLQSFQHKEIEMIY